MISMEQYLAQKYPNTPISERKNNPVTTITRCFLEAKAQKYTFFALQDGYQCFASNASATPNVPDSYTKYSRSTSCNEDTKTGGQLANEVYEVLKIDKGMTSLKLSNINQKIFFNSRFKKKQF